MDASGNNSNGALTSLVWEFNVEAQTLFGLFSLNSNTAEISKLAGKLFTKNIMTGSFTGVQFTYFAAI